MFDGKDRECPTVQVDNWPWVVVEKINPSVTRFFVNEALQGLLRVVGPQKQANFTGRVESLIHAFGTESVPELAVLSENGSISYTYRELGAAENLVVFTGCAGDFFGITELGSVVFCPDFPMVFPEEGLGVNVCRARVG